MTDTDDVPALCRADDARIQDWLASTPPGSRLPVGRRLRLDSTFQAGQPRLAPRLARLVAEAKAAGVYGLAGHDIQLWHVVDDLTLDSYLLTIAPPRGPQLAVTGLTDMHLLGFGQSGETCAVRALRAIAAAVNAELQRHADTCRSSRVSTPPPSRAGVVVVPPSAALLQVQADLAARAQAAADRRPRR